MKFRFKKENPDVKQRKKICDILRNQFSDKIPIICEKAPKYFNIRDIDKTRYLVPSNLTVSEFIFLIRKRNELSKEEAFFLLVNGKHQIYGDTPLSEIYERYKDPKDGLLYIAYASELTWGNI